MAGRRQPAARLTRRFLRAARVVGVSALARRAVAASVALQASGAGLGADVPRATRIARGAVAYWVLAPADPGDASRTAGGNGAVRVHVAAALAGDAQGAASED